MDVSAKLTPAALAAWSAQLQAVRARGLSLCPHAAEIMARWEAWWRFDADRPLLVGTAPRPGIPDPRRARFDLLEDPAAYVRATRAEVEALYFAGDTLPNARIEIGPVALGALAGATLRLHAAEHTTWQDPIIDDWATAPSFLNQHPNRWTNIVLNLADALSRDAAGHYLVLLPELGGVVDVLANLRDPQRLCIDLIENRERLPAALDEMCALWADVYRALHSTILGNGAGVLQWLAAWSDRPYFTATCDFNYLIGPADFREACMPSIRRQAGAVGRSVFHLDGARRHVDALIEDPTITAIQYTPGDGTPSALPHLPMFRKIQDAGKPVMVTLPPDEIPDVLKALDPRGLVLRPSPVRSPAAAEAMLALARQHTV